MGSDVSVPTFMGPAFGAVCRALRPTRGRADTSRSDTRLYGPPRFLLRIVYTSRGVTPPEFPAWGVVSFCFLSARDDPMSSTTFWKHVLSPPKCVSTLSKVPVSQVGMGARGQVGWGSRDGHVRPSCMSPSWVSRGLSDPSWPPGMSDPGPPRQVRLEPLSPTTGTGTRMPEWLSCLPAPLSS